MPKVTVINSSSMKASVNITNGLVVDGINIQPSGRVVLEEGYRVEPNSLARNPSIKELVEEDKKPSDAAPAKKTQSLPNK